MVWELCSGRMGYHGSKDCVELASRSNAAIYRNRASFDRVSLLGFRRAAGRASAQAAATVVSRGLVMIIPSSVRSRARGGARARARALVHVHAQVHVRRA